MFHVGRILFNCSHASTHPGLFPVDVGGWRDGSGVVGGRSSAIASQIGESGEVR